MIYEFEGQVPSISRKAYVFDNATVIGNVHIGDYVWIGPGAVLRGDYGEISIGAYSAIEDNCVIHARPGENVRDLFFVFVEPEIAHKFSVLIVYVPVLNFI